MIHPAEGQSGTPVEAPTSRPSGPSKTLLAPGGAGTGGSTLTHLEAESGGAAPRNARRSSIMNTRRSYFANDITAAAAPTSLGPESGRAASSEPTDAPVEAQQDKFLYAEAANTFDVRRILAALVFAFVVQLVCAMAMLALGMPGNAAVKGLSIGLAVFGTMYSSWGEDFNPAWCRPGSNSFVVAFGLYTVLYAICYAFKHLNYETPPVDDEVLEDYDHPAQPLTILFDTGTKTMTVVVAHTIMYQGHKDASPHMYRLTNCMMISDLIRRSMRCSGVPLLYSLSLCFDALYMGSVLVGVPLCMLKLDKGKTAEDVHGSYTCVVAIALSFLVFFVFFVVSIGLPALAASMALSMLQGAILFVLTPGAKRRYAHDWMFVLPGILLSLEAGQAAVFLGLPLDSAQLYLALFFQLSYSLFKNCGYQLRCFQVINEKLTGQQTSQAATETKYADLTLVAAAHNFAEIAAATIMGLLVLAEAICHAMGLSEYGSHATVMSPYFRESGILGGWRGAVSPAETAAVMALILCARVGCTFLEEAIAEARFAPRRRIVARYMRLLARDGPEHFRTMCLAFLLAILFVMPAELSLFGRDLARIRAAADDE